MSVSVILPTFNERENIAKLISEIRGGLAGAEIIVVDDNSSDGTAEEVARLTESDSNLRLIRRAERGLTTAIGRGIAESCGEVSVWMDCDFSMPPQTIPLLIKEIERGADLAIGSRYAPNGKDARGDWIPVMFSRIINSVARATLGGRIRDYTTGFVAARRRVLDQIPLRGDYGEYCIDLLTRAVRKGFRVVEVGYVCKPRERGESKTAQSFFGFLKRGWPYVATISRLALQRKP